MGLDKNQEARIKASKASMKAKPSFAQKILTRQALIYVVSFLVVILALSRVLGAQCRAGFYLNSKNVCVEDACYGQDCEHPRECEATPEGECRLGCKFPFKLKEGECVDACPTSCPDNARCQMNDAKTSCEVKCVDGFHVVNGQCVRQTKCDKAACPVGATCKESEDRESCLAECPEGMAVSEANGAPRSCVPSDPCLSIRCPDGATCTAEGRECSVKCPEGTTRAKNGDCMRSDACDGFFCPEYASCSAVGDSCVARCADGFKPQGEECILVGRSFDPCTAYECPEGHTCEAIGRQCVAKRA